MASVFFAIYFDVLRMAKEQFRASMSAIWWRWGSFGLGYWSAGPVTCSSP
jgi:hypothetical protein